MLSVIADCWSHVSKLNGLHIAYYIHRIVMADTIESFQHPQT